jgi:hypothetical protein
VFTSQRGERLTEAGIHHWFRTLKTQATKDEWELINDVTYHELRHDFAHRTREAGWTIEEVAYYLGHVTRKGGGFRLTATLGRNALGLCGAGLHGCDVAQPLSVGSA